MARWLPLSILNFRSPLGQVEEPKGDKKGHVRVAISYGSSVLLLPLCHRNPLETVRALEANEDTPRGRFNRGERPLEARPADDRRKPAGMREEVRPVSCQACD